jgi:hypothetical protein
MIAEPVSVAVYESQVERFKPEHGHAAMNSNDLRLFIYEWFTRFEHSVLDSIEQALAVALVNGYAARDRAGPTYRGGLGPRACGT